MRFFFQRGGNFPAQCELSERFATRSEIHSSDRGQQLSNRLIIDQHENMYSRRFHKKVKKALQCVRIKWEVELINHYDHIKPSIWKVRSYKTFNMLSRTSPEDICSSPCSLKQHFRLEHSFTKCDNQCGTAGQS